MLVKLTKGVTYATALAYCKGLSMRLPEITTAAQQTFVNQFAAVSLDSLYCNSGFKPVAGLKNRDFRKA